MLKPVEILMIAPCPIRYFGLAPMTFFIDRKSRRNPERD
jgi:hypothetical protein